MRTVNHPISSRKKIHIISIFSASGKPEDMVSPKKIPKKQHDFIGLGNLSNEIVVRQRLKKKFSTVGC